MDMDVLAAVVQILGGVVGMVASMAQVWEAVQRWRRR